MIVPTDWVQFINAWTRRELGVTNTFAYKLPATKPDPVGRFQRITGGARDGHRGWVHDPIIQFDAWAATEAACYPFAETISALLDQNFDGLMTVNGVSIVCSHVRVGGMTHGYDDQLARSTFTFSLVAHPVL